MHIAIVAGPYLPVPPPQYGGSEQVIYYLVKGLKETGHTPILLASGDSTINCELIPIVDKAIKYPQSIDGMAVHRQLELEANKRTLRELQKLLPKIDVIHSHNFDLLPFAGFPNVTTLHGMFEFGQLDYFKKHSALNYVSISNNQQRAYPGLNYISTVYNGEDPGLFPLVTEPQDYLCFLGRFDWDKSPHLAIDLALALNMKIKLAGKVDYRGESYFKDKIQPLLEHPLVEYLGELGFDDKIALLSHARCNLHPTNFREPFGLAVLEAAYCGTPTLATARGSMPEVIKAGTTGMLVEDFVEGVHAVRQCFGMDRYYIAQHARQKFNYSKMTQGYVRAYQTAIKTAKRQGYTPRRLARSILDTAV